MTRWALIYNPTAGSYRPGRLEAVRAALAAEGVSTDALESQAPGHVTELARDAARMPGVSCVAAFGGDGTLREAAQGLLGSERPLAFLPGGSANSMARELGLPLRPEAAALALLRGRVQTVRPGQVDGRCFLMMAGFGFDGLAIHLISKGLKNRLGSVGYILTGFRCLVHRHPILRVAAGGVERRAVWAVAARSGRYAGFLRIHPSAGLQRERLGLTAVNGWMLLPFGIGRLLLRLPVRGPGLWLEEHGAFSVRADEPVHAHLDGDYLRQDTGFEVGPESRTVALCVP